jgi:hypothetical protein
VVIICAWCGIKIAETAEGPKDMISHGVCEECEKIIQAQMEDEK